MSKIIHVARAAALTMFLSLAAVAVPAPAPAAEPLAVIPLEPYGGTHVTARVEAGGVTGRFLVDTAGGVTSVGPGFAKAVGCTPWGRLSGFRMRGDRLDIGRCDDARFRIAGRTFAAPIAGVFDFAALTPPGAPVIDGLLALDVFAGHAVTLDLAGRRLVVESPASLKARVRGAAEVPVRYSREVTGLALTPFAAVETPQGCLWMELDSGSDGAVVVGRHAAAALGLDPAAPKGQAATLRMADGPTVQTRALLADLIYDGNIGAPILQRWVVTFDLARGRLWIAERREAEEAGRTE